MTTWHWISASTQTRTDNAELTSSPRPAASCSMCSPPTAPSPPTPGCSARGFTCRWDLKVWYHKNSQFFLLRTYAKCLFTNISSFSCCPAFSLIRRESFCFVFLAGGLHFSLSSFTTPFQSIRWVSVGIVVVVYDVVFVFLSFLLLLCFLGWGAYVTTLPHRFHL